MMLTFVGFLWWFVFDIVTAEQVVLDPLGCVHAHNVVRARHGSGNITWDDHLAHDAVEWALHLVKLNTMSLSVLDGYGENLYSVWGTKAPVRCHKAVYSWYLGVSNYDFNKPGYDSSTGHFTQVVWKDTKRIGVGIAYDPSSRNTYIVARYSPRGNNATESFGANVPKPIPGIPMPKRSELVHSFEELPFIATVPTKYSNDTSCDDNDSQCPFFVDQGYCSNEQYRPWMLDNCRKSCKFCKSGPVTNGGWSSWIDIERCQGTCTKVSQRFCVNPAPSNGGTKCDGPYSKGHPCTGDLCNPHCVDRSEQCRLYAMMGHCYQGALFYQWMMQNCKNSCHLCPSMESVTLGGNDGVPLKAEL